MLASKVSSTGSIPIGVFRLAFKASGTGSTPACSVSFLFSSLPVIVHFPAHQQVFFLSEEATERDHLPVLSEEGIYISLGTSLDVC
jgi:hypothetical protein